MRATGPRVSSGVQVVSREGIGGEEAEEDEEERKKMAGENPMRKTFRVLEYMPMERKE